VAREAVDEVVLAAVCLVGDDDDVAPLREYGVPACLAGRQVALRPIFQRGGKNFWMVVKTTPPEATASFSRRSARSAACAGGCRSSSRQRAKVPKSWSSRSLRSVRTTIVGFSMAGCRITRPA